MSGHKKPPRSGPSSITYTQNRFDRATFSQADFYHERHHPSISGGKKESCKYFEPKSPKILSTTELISAVGQIWDLVNLPAVFKTNAKLNQNDCGCQKNCLLGNLCREEVGGILTLNSACEDYSIDARTSSPTPPAMQNKFELLKISQKMPSFEPCGENYVRSLFRQFSKGGVNLPKESWKERRLASIGISNESEKTGRWVKERIPAKSQHLVPEVEKANFSKNCTPEVVTSGASDCNSGYSANLPHPDSSLKSKEALVCTMTCAGIENAMTSSLCFDYFLGDLQESNVNNSISPASSSSLCVDYHIEYLGPCRSTYESFQREANDYKVRDANDYKVSKSTRGQLQDTISQDRNRLEIHTSACERPHHALAKQEHAFAGALAGVFVSLCLHPVDTLKTVIQSCHGGQRSIFCIGKSIVSERGITGLYRGIASNIASSAPISAIYTFTYESVKGSLLPLFPKDYCFLAHCIAGGCASIATSTVFTPSERVKQQMQIGSRYHNCWKALIGIITHGGLPSLYAGWGAVLCRNVPHSIIKFYTYESLKPLMLSPQSSTAAPNAVQTLFCGGLAGSTAALFTTPFDVVKTRLQTQIPGSTSKYRGAFHALEDIGKNEGLKGLYRGLVPRLIMYMSQGALFFASYETFKRLFSLDVL